ncbi:MAG: Dyp-type peroxidase [Acidimicrobiales bacterium]
MSELDYGDIQGTILRGYRVDRARHLVLRVRDAAAARAVLGSLVDGTEGRPQVTTAAPWATKPESFLNLGITAAGLAALGVPPETLAGFPGPFLRGATADTTTALVGDVGPSHPAHWVEGLADGSRVHVILSLWATGPARVIDEVTDVLRSAFTGAFEELTALDANALPGNQVHFGYRDNIAQPRVEGAPPGKRLLRDPQPVVPAGAFLMGHANQYGGTYSVQPDELSTNSSFAAFRLLEQDVAGFERFLEQSSTTAGIDAETLAAKVCGRWRNGMPLVLSPDGPTPELPPDRLNDFDYVSADATADDTFGYRCPVGSHIRRTNPRSQRVVGGGGALHRIIRRAMPYGPPFDPGSADDHERGLVGWFINADIGNQFEFLMSQWVNTDTFVMSVSGPAGANPAKNVSGHDLLAGATDAGSSSFTLSSPATSEAGWANTTLTGFPGFVTTRGGAYGYLPSITAIRYLAALPGSGPDPSASTS